MQLRRRGDWLLKEQVDLALLYDRADAAAVQIELLLTDTLHLVGSAKLPRPADLSVEVLAATPLIATTAAYGWRRRLENGLQAFDLKPTIRAEVDSLSVTKELVVRGFAYAVLPSTAVTRNCSTARCGPCRSAGRRSNPG